MARVSIDDAASGSSSSSSRSKGKTPARSASAPESHGHDKAVSSGAVSKFDTKQKVKAIGAIVVIIFAGLFIAWNMGLFGTGGGEADSGLTAEQVQAYNEQVQREEAEQRKAGTSREAPVPLGSN